MISEIQIGPERRGFVYTKTDDVLWKCRWQSEDGSTRQKLFLLQVNSQRIVKDTAEVLCAYAEVAARGTEVFRTTEKTVQCLFLVCLFCF